MLEQFGAIAILAGVAFIFPFIPLIASAIINIRKPSKEKLLAYECGVDPIGRSWIQFKTSYFLYALAFVAFDVETVFLYPWAIVFRSMEVSAFIAMFVFMAILLLGLWYAWKKGALEWK
ncbi:MAG TPA: NADH-quinone oxidoreductase subunit A [Negativicutes bacterium]|nr:NADH-quinone oxidoreductase subunit A [Negativicutes bacterium]